jgi:hypothetical protein
MELDLNEIPELELNQPYIQDEGGMHEEDGHVSIVLSGAPQLAISSGNSVQGNIQGTQASNSQISVNPGSGIHVQPKVQEEGIIIGLPVQPLLGNQDEACQNISDNANFFLPEDLLQEIASPLLLIRGCSPSSHRSISIFK